MTPEQVAVVQKTYAMVDEHRELFAQAFYERLFVANPNISLLFDENLDQQIERFRVMLFTAVYGLTRAEELKPALRSLGQRHLHYGVRPADYIAFGVALLGTLQHFLADDFDAEARDAWKAFYAFLSDTMNEGLDRQAGRLREASAGKRSGR